MLLKPNLSWTANQNKILPTVQAQVSLQGDSLVVRTSANWDSVLARQ